MFSEAKDGFKTSEFYVMVIFVAAVLLTTYLDADTLAREDVALGGVRSCYLHH